MNTLSVHEGSSSPSLVTNIHVMVMEESTKFFMQYAVFYETSYNINFKSIYFLW